MSSQWEEMEMFESDSDPLAVSTACWLGQYTFGIIASVIFGGISKIFFSSTSLAVTIGSTLGVFAGSSGGQILARRHREAVSMLLHSFLPTQRYRFMWLISGLFTMILSWQKLSQQVQFQ